MSRKNLRRKPPPPLDGYQAYGMHTTYSSNPVSPLVASPSYVQPPSRVSAPTSADHSVATTNGSTQNHDEAYFSFEQSDHSLSSYDNRCFEQYPHVQSSQYPHEQSSQHPHEQSSQHQSQLLPEYPADFKTEREADYLCYDTDSMSQLTDDFLDASLLMSTESPRPKGPQDLPQDCFLPQSSAYSPHPTPRSRLAHTSQPSPFNPTGDHRQEPDGPTFRRFQNLSLGRAASDSDTSSLEFTNYDDYIADSPTLVSHQEASRANSRSERGPAPKSFELPYPLADPETSESLDLGSWATPTRIPTLAARDQINRYSGSESPSQNTTSPNLQFIKTANQAYVSYSTSPDSPFDSRSSSPTKMYVNRTPRNDYASHVSESRSSRSPSPKKYTTSPLVKSPSKLGASIYPPEDNFSEILDSYYEESRMPRWSLIEHDDFDYFDDSFIQPPENDQFDYSILPELPQRQAEPEKKDLEPLHHQKGFTLHATPTVRRKNDDLPPVPLTLPSLPFSSSLLSNLHFATCPNVWSLKNIFDWCVKLTSWMNGEKIPQKELKKSLIKLLAYCKPDIPVDMINRNAGDIISSFLASGILMPVDDDKLGTGPEFEINIRGEIQGVLVDLTDCYSFDESHKKQKDLSQKCYSSQCPINKVIEHERLMKCTDIDDLNLGSDWASHWKLSAQDMTIDISESKLQSFLFDLIKFEQTFIQRAECFIEVAGPEFIRQAKLTQNGQTTAMKDFEHNIFSSSSKLCSIHEDSLYKPLLRILVGDGKFIKRVTDMAKLYTSWSKEAKNPLLAYMSAMPMIQDLLNNPALKSWDQALRLNPKVKDLQVNGSLLLMSTFNSRYQQLPLQLMDIRKFFDEGDEEFSALTEAIESIRGLGARVNEMKVYADNIHSLQEVQAQLTWKSNVFHPSLHLSSKNRKLFYRGDLLRKGELKINSSYVHVIVLDNYVLLTDKQRHQKSLSMKVSENPIPVDYLIVENREKEAATLGYKPSIQSSSLTEEASEETSSYPFKIRYAGRGKALSHTLIAGSESDRQKWISILQQSKSNATKRNASTAPYNFKLIESRFFAYEPAMKLTKVPILAANDPISVLAKEDSLALAGSTTFINRQVQCSEMFNFMNGQFHFLGTSAGVYCFDEKNIWKKIINMNNVTRLTVIPESNVALVLANKMLRYYPLQSLINLYYEKKERVTSYQISNESILFYEFGQHLGLPTLIVAKRKNAGSTTFKVLVLQEDNNGILSTIEVVKKFYIQAECYGISIFNTSLAVHTQRGFEILDLQKLSPRTIPEFPGTDTSSKKLDGYSRKKVGQTPDLIKKVISHAMPLGMFKMTNNKEFLLVFSECAIFVNRAGKLSRTSMVRFDYRAKDIAFADNNLFLVCEECIEVWAISDSASTPNKLAQVIPNKDIHLLNAKTLTFRVVNPIKPDVQLMFRLSKKPSQ